jgi:uncharacterized membrane protein
MILILHWGAIILFTIFGIVGFHFTFKRYNPTDRINFLDTYPTLISIVGEIILWISKKLFPERVHIIIYKSFTFIFGAVSFLITFLLIFDLLNK